MARDFGDTVECVGKEKGPIGNVGDILIRVNTRDTGGAERSIVVEAKNKPITVKGKGSFLKELDEAMDNRGADYAIGAVHESHTPTSCGCFRFFDGSKIVCSVPEEDAPLPLEIAYKVARFEKEKTPPRLISLSDATGPVYFEFTEVEGGGTVVKATYGSALKGRVAKLKATLPLKVPATPIGLSCPSCGKPVLKEFNLCPYCGTELIKE